METASRKELILTIEKQKEQLSRYETRFRDVVIAYKGLIKEKEALEASFKALSGSTTKLSKPAQYASKENVFDDGPEPNQANAEVSSEEGKKESVVSNDEEQQGEETVEQLHTQLTTLMNSLATLSAEKSRMEASFQADKKQLRQEKEERERIMKDLQVRLHQISKQHQNELEDLRSKLIVERHERDKEQNDHGVMIRELQKLLADERRQKDHMESVAEEFRSKLTQNESQSGQREQVEKRLRDMRNELEATRRKLRRAETKAKEAPPLLLELQEEMAGMKLQHQAAIFEEQKRAADAEERARRLAFMHEERVANLEARLAELSDTVGSYDRLRQQDQLAIVKLKEHIAQLDVEQSALARVAPRPPSPDPNKELKGKSEADLNQDLQALVEQILGLKGQLLLANQRVDKPIDLFAVLSAGDFGQLEPSDLHQSCRDDQLRLQKEFELYKKQQQPNNHRKDSSDSEVADLKAQVKNLKERVHILNVQLDDTEKECKEKVDKLQTMLRADRASAKVELAACENDFRCHLALLEQQLQKQRERSLALLEDKEQEIRTLKSTFQAFLPGNGGKDMPPSAKEAVADGVSDDVLRSLSQFSLGPAGGGESPHMLHYAHELARRDVEISNLRKAKHQLETALRQLQRASTNGDDRHRERVDQLKEEVARLERCKSREGANLEYLKNVVLSFLLSGDPNCKRHMLNAIAAVLKFSSAELDRVNRTDRAPVQPAPV